ncbi:MAG: antibiotic biosynthesis monooxygenase [Pseudomonadota bacterium]
MSVVVNAVFKAKPESFDALVAFLATILPDTAKFEGVELVSCFADAEDHSVVVHEVWAEKANQEAYLGWRSENGDVARIVALLREPPAFQERLHVAF